jgi:hydroxymethylglutaryl-CoA reductase
MNERIKELASQAEEYASKRDMTGEYVIAFDQDKYSKKFAELIVRECIQAIQNESMNSDDEWERGLVYAENGIKEHFGVK